MIIMSVNIGQLYTVNADQQYINDDDPVERDEREKGLLFRENFPTLSLSRCHETRRIKNQHAKTDNFSNITDGTFRSVYHVFRKQ
jgi:hypothetical protein